MKIKAVIDNPSERIMTVVLCGKNEKGVEMSVTEIASRFVNRKDVDLLRIASQNIEADRDNVVALITKIRSNYASSKEIEVASDFDKEQPQTEIFESLANVAVRNFAYVNNKSNGERSDE